MATSKGQYPQCLHSLCTQIKHSPPKKKKKKGTQEPWEPPTQARNCCAHLCSKWKKCRPWAPVKRWCQVVSGQSRPTDVSKHPFLTKTHIQHYNSSHQILSRLCYKQTTITWSIRQTFVSEAANLTFGVKQHVC